ncbi:MAG: glutamyl-tRNA reductase [Gammaproteobacteria bacterium]|nr:glutamyl-tRNA reductase [Gammaproteobacteria bacterium]NIR84624.1 glutamyl-tRNA reductase [Gammaproteobacteria bacterium]NIR90527.1 glutamyl-tRNA reductase [Gammaproteobacteria bacterium]NIU05675.1 glutamyl-tRNA reductase [Gammaproteobacteria bacterium]NIV52814.1 glutamyl-tRNA reductase [Gammaproteobacteria bacterium]
MHLLAFGLNHRTAPLALRERVVFPRERVSGALRELLSCEGVEEAAILSTCNRTDLYCRVSEENGDGLRDWFRTYHGLSAHEVRRHLYTHRADSAVRHVLRVASGLDSMILGEPQVLGQLKDAYTTAVRTGTLGTVLRRLFQHSFSVAKRVRTDTAIGSSPVSVAFAAVTLARQIFGDLGERRALLIGAGETIELAARHLKSGGLGRLVIANRTPERAQQLASELGGFALALRDAPSHLADADIVFASTASPTPILSVADARRAIHARKRRPIFMVDLAVPRDIDPTVGELEDVYLYTVDELRDVVQENLRSREGAARQAEGIIDIQVGYFMDWLRALDAVPAIRTLRGNAELTRDEVLARAQRMAASGVPPEEALEYLANVLTNKLLHAPTVQLRRAGAEGREDLLEAARRLLELDDPTRSEDE